MRFAIAVRLSFYVRATVKAIDGASFQGSSLGCKIGVCSRKCTWRARVTTLRPAALMQKGV